MKRTSLYVALASALSLSPLAFANDSASHAQQSQNEQQQGQSQNQDLVKQAQEKLSALGKDVGTPDGQLGAKTKQALQEFQQENGLQPSGQLDQQTIAALNLDESSSAATGGSAPESSQSQPQGQGQGADTQSQGAESQSQPGSSSNTY